MYDKPIYTIETECQDCYKCLRECPVKAIEIKNNHANIIYENCILCGHCTQVCPVHAKKVRNDVLKVKEILNGDDDVYVSLAPSYISEYKDYDYRQLLYALKLLGFNHISETALGAQEVSSHIASLISTATSNSVYISSACPTIVQYIKKYFPHYSDHLTSIVSPVLAHGMFLKQTFGSNIKVIFIGPCIAKKAEIDECDGIIDGAITFEELNEWFAEKNISIRHMPVDDTTSFVPHKAEEGSLYPIDGGMIRTVKEYITNKQVEYMTFSGATAVQNALHSIPDLKLTTPLFLELMACEGGCINGPKTCSENKTVSKRLAVTRNSTVDATAFPRKPHHDLSGVYNFMPVQTKKYSEHDITMTLRSIGKYLPKDELNCGGCGYNSCRDFANALLQKKAESTMCLSYMRKRAQKKADALLQAMPSGAVIIDNSLKIIECNRQFAVLLGEDIEFLFDEKPGLEGVNVKKLFPDHHLLFNKIFETDISTINKEIHFDNKYFHLSIFSIEDGATVGAIIQDITEPSVHKEAIIDKAKQVIDKNLVTVQQIAFLLGENAAESEVILNSIVDSFTPELTKN